ncbi:hypothetical protein NQ315_002039, partial [Exocentrus adspersus]
SQSSVDNMSCPSTPSTPTSPIPYEIQIATEDDRESILNFLQTFFFRDEPLNSYLGIITEETPRCLDLENFSLKELNNGVNLKAVYNGKIIGVSLNGILERGWLGKDDPYKHGDTKFGIILDLLERVARESDPFKKYPDCEKAMTVKILSVDGTYRGKGIAKALMAKTRELAKEHGCGFMSVDCTSHFTACALKNLGFELHYSLKYVDHKVNGEVVLNPAPPHVAVTVYTQKID